MSYLQHMNAHYTEHECKEDSDEEQIENRADTLYQAQAHILQLLYPIYRL